MAKAIYDDLSGPREGREIRPKLDVLREFELLGDPFPDPLPKFLGVSAPWRCSQVYPIPSGSSWVRGSRSSPGGLTLGPQCVDTSRPEGTEIPPKPCIYRDHAGSMGGITDRSHSSGAGGHRFESCPRRRTETTPGRKARGSSLCPTRSEAIAFSGTRRRSWQPHKHVAVSDLAPAGASHYVRIEQDLTWLSRNECRARVQCVEPAFRSCCSHLTCKGRFLAARF